MAANLDYLDPNLIPLEEKAQAYIDAEQELRRIELARQVATAQPEHQQQLTQSQQALQAELDRLHGEILALLPTRNEWVKVNLGYGPSRVGAWHVPAAEGRAEHYEIRVVH